MKGEATVVKHTGSHYLLTMLPKWELFPAVLRGRVRLTAGSTTNPLAVGDRVIFETTDGLVPDEKDPAVISEVLPRSNYVIRKSTNLSRQAHIIAANVDQAFIVVTLAFPEVKLQFLDRLLVTCEVYGVRPCIVLNKIDIFNSAAAAGEFGDALRRFHEIYEGAGYRIVEVSARTGQGIAGLRSLCRGVSLFSGVSGVGKSSLIKALDPSLSPKISEISEAHLQGRHTTTFYEMYPLHLDCAPDAPDSRSAGEEITDGSDSVREAYIIDTPGIRGFGLVDVPPEEIALYFPEMLKASRSCRFTPCTHTHEPDCAVKAAVEEGIVTPERYSSYLGMLDESGKYRV